MDIPATPNVFINPPSIPSQPMKKGVPKIIFLILGVGVLIIVWFGVKFLAKPAQKVEPLNTSITTIPEGPKQAAGKMILESPQKEYRAGESIPVSVKIDTGGAFASGADVILKFDSKVLEASSASLIKGTIFAEYPVARVEEGVVRLTGITSLSGQDFSGSGIFATIIFKGKSPGKSMISFDYTPTSTVDSNIFGPEVAGDMLKEVSNLEVIVR